jgi:hypothetical protein
MHDVMSPASKKGFDIKCMPRMALMLGMVICIRTTGDVYVVCMSKNPYGITNIYTVCYTTWPTSICCNQGASMGFCQQAAKCCVCGQCFGGGGGPTLLVSPSTIVDAVTCMCAQPHIYPLVQTWGRWSLSLWRLNCG